MSIARQPCLSIRIATTQKNKLIAQTIAEGVYTSIAENEFSHNVGLILQDFILKLIFTASTLSTNNRYKRAFNKQPIQTNVPEQTIQAVLLALTNKSSEREY
jgi:hypothetical protein